MKKIVMMLAAFLVIGLATSNAQVFTQQKQYDDVEYKDSNKSKNLERQHRKNVQGKHKMHARNKKMHKAERMHARSMRKVAEADGRISKRERHAMRQEQKKFKMRKHRAHQKMKRRQFNKNTDRPVRGKI